MIKLLKLHLFFTNLVGLDFELYVKEYFLVDQTDILHSKSPSYLSVGSRFSNEENTPFGHVIGLLTEFFLFKSLVLNRVMPPTFTRIRRRRVYHKRKHSVFSRFIYIFLRI